MSIGNVEAVLQFYRAVIPGEHPPSVFAEASPDRPRDLAGMTNSEAGSQGEGCGGGCFIVVKVKKPGKWRDLENKKRGGSLGATPLR